MLKLFRVTSLVEGISYLLILCVSLGLISRDFVFEMGMAHGALFMLFFVFSMLAAHKQGWSVTIWVLLLLSALVPFAFVAVEMFLQKQISQQQQEAIA